MTREELIQAIYDNDEKWSCPFHNCGKYGNDSCMKCADNQLTEYEHKVRADALNVLLARATDKAIDTEVGKFIHLNELRVIIEQMKEVSE